VGRGGVPLHSRESLKDSINVRYQGQPGKHLLPASISHFEPKRTSQLRLQS
jgi:hypothetical protein